jgi:AcrR family transcriptional regulator
MIEEQIAARLEQKFSQNGFAKPSVAELKKVSGVSLRTLYRYFPSKELMVIGALEHRHRRYLNFIATTDDESAHDSILRIFSQLGAWMEDFAPNGCMSMNALAAFPDNELIHTAVMNHKKEILKMMVALSQSDRIGAELFLLHEGVSSAWSIIGIKAVESAQLVAQRLLGANK